MGAWGHNPWDNDAAADFFAELFPPGFHERVMAGLRGDSEEEARAAAWVVVRLAYSCYVWPCDAAQFDELCKLAAERLETIAKESEEGDEFWDWNELRKEAEELHSRRHRPLGQEP